MTDVLGTHATRGHPDQVDLELASASKIKFEGTSLSVGDELDATVEARWHGSYRALLIFSDVLAILAALLLGFVLRFQTPADPATDFLPALLLVLAVGLTWLLSLVICDAYEVRRVCTGPEEWSRLVRATALAFGLVVIGCFFARQDVARGLLVIVFPIGVVLLAFGRLNVRRIVRLRRATADWHHRILAIGTTASVNHLIATSKRAAQAGVVVVGACVDDTENGARIDENVPVVGNMMDASEHANRLGADLVAVVGGDLGPVAVRELSWELEGTGTSLVMTHPVSDVAAPRLHVSPLEGMPMVWVDQPQFTGMARRVKRLFDIVAAMSALVILAPVLAIVSTLVKLTSRGPVLFRQSRLGLDGTEFHVLKFRTMVDGAEAMRHELMHQNESDGALFKMQSDPRITKLGARLRQLSIDELPQLWNVVRGEMSLVGPRPIATIDSDYDGPARRRLLVRPGITGLWQVSGRSDLRWEDAVELDLYYVENWSLGLDLNLVGKTIIAVLLRRGAY